MPGVRSSGAMGMPAQCRHVSFQLRQTGAKELGRLSGLSFQRTHEHDSQHDEERGKQPENQHPLLPEGQCNAANEHHDTEGEQESGADSLGPQRHEAEFLLLQFGDQ